MLKNYILLIAILLGSISVSAQNGDIRGEVTDGEEVLPGATILLFKGQARVKALMASGDGSFILGDLTSGDYILQVSYAGYRDYKEEIYLEPGESIYKSINMTSSVVRTREMVIRKRSLETTKPLIKDVEDGPYNTALEAVVIDPSITVRDGQYQASNTRPEQLAIIKDNVTQIGPVIPSTLNIGQVEVIANGVPAIYGDFLGAAIEFTSKTNLDTVPIRKILLRSGSPFNPYHQNNLETLVYKPLKKENGQTTLALTHSMVVNFRKDANPSLLSTYEIKDESRDDLLDVPFVTQGGAGDVAVAESFTSEDFEQIRANQNASRQEAYTNLKLEWKPSSNVILRVEPSLQYNRRQRFSFSNSLMNSEHNPVTTSITGKLNAQIQHNLKTPYNSKGQYTYDSTLFSKISYTVIADYQRFNTSTVDPIHQDNIFDYGHVGTFHAQGEDSYEYIDEARVVTDQNGKEVVLQGYYALNGYSDTSLTFTPNEKNAYRAAITQYAIRNGEVRNLDELAEAQGLLNGRNPNSVSGMWSAPGTVLSNYSKSDRQKSTLTALLNLSMNPKRTLKEQHDLQLGITFEQQRRSYYSLEANELWQLMPQLLNQQYSQLDESNAELTYDERGMFTDTVNFRYREDLSQQSTFDKNLRSIADGSNGYRSGGSYFVDVNSIAPGDLSMDMFSADELWNNGSSYVNYAGYDHTGRLLRGRKGLNDFLNNEADRFINSYNPIYTAAWLQDKFVLKNIKIRAGVRIERFDGNQQVLKDPYTLYPAKSVREVSDLAGQAVDHPSSISDDAVVYVNDMNNPTDIAGYRSGSQWYDADGNELSGGEAVRLASSNGVIQPYLVDPSNQRLTTASFRDFKPTILVLPRLSFSFPMSGTAMFYAYYDKFAQRPNYGQTFAPINSYYYLANASNTLLANPDLKPAQRTDYQFGYKQLIGDYGVLNLKVGYAEIKNDINLIQVEQAYPRSYTTYGNVDFSTVKSFGADYSTRIGRGSIRANYLLQYADGTGSNVNSAAALIQVGQPNLRSLYPLEFDIRHKFNMNFSYAMDSLSRRAKGIFRGMNLNVFANTQSGSPFTANALATPEALSLGTVSRSQIKGNPFGSRMPWNYSLDLSISKIVMVKNQALTIQLNAINVLNIRNIYDVYAYTASPSDDGYLSSPQGQQQIRNELNAQSFVNYYNLKQNDPGNFGTPRMLSLTVRTTF